MGMIFSSLFFVPPLHSHEVRPGYLEMEQIQEGTFHVKWKIPALGDRRLRIQPLLPTTCKTEGVKKPMSDGLSFIETWTVACADGIKEKRIEIEGLSKTKTDVLVRIKYLTGDVEVQRLTSENSFFVVEGSPDFMDVVYIYSILGMEHILWGFDHLLFVLGLLILVNNRRKLILTISAFTLAHSLTLAAATLEWVYIPQAPVEAVIALSILFLAVEIAPQNAQKNTLSKKFPWVVAFTFGLLHGFGFAGALQDIGFPAQAVPSALLFFNVGVELGQILFIAAVGVILISVKRFVKKWPAWSASIPAYAIGGLSAFWLMDRLSNLLAI